MSEDSVTVSIKDPKNPDKAPETREIPSGFTLWSTGIAMNPSVRLFGSPDLQRWITDASLLRFTFFSSFVQMVVQKLPNQFHKKAVEVDNHLRVTGAPQGTIYAIGDASTVSPVTFPSPKVGPLTSSSSSFPLPRSRLAW